MENNGDKIDLTWSRFTKRKPINTNRIRSLVNDCPDVNLIQSPKQPHSFILPDRTAYPVRKVKKIMSIKSNQLNNLNCQPINTATPAMISKAIIKIEKASV